MTAEHTAEGTSPTASAPFTVYSIPLAEVFAEWDRQHREEPTAFRSAVERILAGESIETYGEAAALTLIGIARQMADERGVFA